MSIIIFFILFLQYLGLHLMPFGEISHQSVIPDISDYPAASQSLLFRYKHVRFAFPDSCSEKKEIYKKANKEKDKKLSKIE